MQQPARRHVAIIERHQVADGETLDGLAASVGLSVAQLGIFNWGSSDHARLQRHLRDDVGCATRSADGKSYVFSNDDEPGIVCLPSEWTAQGLSTGRGHILRVREIVIDKYIDWKFSI